MTCLRSHKLEGSPGWEPGVWPGLLLSLPHQLASEDPPLQASTDQSCQECSIHETGGICRYLQRPRIMALWEELSNKEISWAKEQTKQMLVCGWVGMPPVLDQIDMS